MFCSLTVNEERKYICINYEKKRRNSSNFDKKNFEFRKVLMF